MTTEMPVDGFVETTAMLVISLGMILSFIRLVLGPTLPDRVIALDLISILGLGMLTVYSVASGESVFLDIGIVLTLVTFLATVAFAYFIEKGTPVRRGDID
jgi:multicomponent Na+:H+ antiporter subunit F